MQKDFDDFQRELANSPEKGAIIKGTGGVRKIRLKSASSGKSSGFRVCYYFLMQDNEIFFLLIYSKNAQENLTMQQKKELKELVEIVRRIKK